MKHEVNIFGQRICIKNGCPAWNAYKVWGGDTYGGFCEARLDFLGRVSSGDDGAIVFGPVCKLPPKFKLVER